MMDMNAEDMTKDANEYAERIGKRFDVDPKYVRAAEATLVAVMLAKFRGATERDQVLGFMARAIMASLDNEGKSDKVHGPVPADTDSIPILPAAGTFAG